MGSVDSTWATKHGKLAPAADAPMAVKRPFLKQKPRLYFDENFPEEVVRHFCNSSHWKKIKGISSTSCGNSGKPDRYHYLYSQRHRYTLVTLDYDFNNDQLYPFTTNGEMRGVIIVRASSAKLWQVVDRLARLLEFVLWLPLPNAFLAETKFVAAHDGVMIRGRDAVTREIKTLRVRSGQTSTRDVRQYFSF